MIFIFLIGLSEATAHFIETRHVIWCPHDDPRTALICPLIFSKIKLTLEDLGFQRRMGDLEISRM